MHDNLPTDQLSAYLDGELTDAEVSELEHRLARDSSLRADLDQLRYAVDLLRTHGPISAPVDLYRYIIAATDQEPMPGGWWRWLQRPFGVPIQGVAVALVAGLVLIVSVPVATMQLGGATSSPRDVDAAWPTKVLKSPQSSPASPSNYGDADEAPIAVEQAAKPVRKKSRKSGLTSRDKVQRDTMASTTGATTSGTPDDQRTAADSNSKTSDFTMYSDGSTYRIAVSPDELDSLLRLVQRYEGRLHQGGGNNPVTTAQTLPAGEHTYTVQLDDAQARNGFTQSLKRTFNGRYYEHVGDGDFLTIDGTRVTIQLKVSNTAGADGSIKTMRRAVPEDHAEDIDILRPKKLPSGQSGTPAN
jgi:negative regulator of sigma E activity